MAFLGSESYAFSDTRTEALDNGIRAIYQSKQDIQPTGRFQIQLDTLFTSIVKKISRLHLESCIVSGGTFDTNNVGAMISK
jgi:hypothetical protein